MTTLLDLARLTIRETQRRRILWIGALMGLAFLVIFGLGFHFVYEDMKRELGVAESNSALMFLTLAGLYATNFLVIMVSVLTSVATISGEIESHTVESLLTKPIKRWQLVLGKWLGFAAIILAYVLLMPGGILLVVYLRSGFTLSNVAAGLLLIYLEGLVAMSITIAGGTRLSTLANGALAFMLFGLAFVGGWVEQIGAFLRNEMAVNIGIVASLLMPSEVLWKKASTIMEPRTALGLDDLAGPFTVASQPSDLMIAYAVVYMAAAVGLGIFLFTRRDI
jgi:ABC-type transport system involved in multi-copper enzyme maturation permease subunit